MRDPAANSSAIAICGIGLRLPGRVHSTRDLWELLINGRDARGPIPLSRYNCDAFDDSLGAKDTFNLRQGYFLDVDLARFDSSFTLMSRKDIERCDPQQRQLLEVVKEALDDAGEVEFRGRRVGCYVGGYGEDWMRMVTKDAQYQEKYDITAHGDYMLANRLSYEYDLRGPSMTIKSSCAGSLTALHEACRALQAGDATSAIVASSSLIMQPLVATASRLEGVTSPDASCKTFDAGANGFARAEGVNAIYVKPLADALRDRNPVRAVVRATGVNTNGNDQALSRPSVAAQTALIRRVYRDAGLDPAKTAFVECHGTGTAAGDVVETTAIGNIFGDAGVMIGTIKPNIGHAEPASGLSGLIKAVLALEHRIIPPNIKFNTPNPRLAFRGKGLSVPTSPTAFPFDRHHRISVNSFGLGGTNAHAVVEQVPCVCPRPLTEARPELLLFSANSQTSLGHHVDQFQEFIRANSHINGADLAYTLALRRERLPCRSYAIFNDGQVVLRGSCTSIPPKALNLYLVFTGQGAQWAGMGRELLDSDALFKADIEIMQSTLGNASHPLKWSLLEELQRSSHNAAINTPELAQPLCTALQVALVNKLRRAGARVTAVVGHSSGEIAAAYAAGAISMQAAIIIAYYRGHVLRHKGSQGAMAVVGLGPEDVSHFASEGVWIACENSPSSTTLSGDAQKVDDALTRIREALPDVLAKPLRLNVAYHSYHMVPFAAEYEGLLRRDLDALGKWHDAAVSKFISTVSGDFVDSHHVFGPSYWASNLTSTVKFSTAVSRLLALEGDGLFVEVGPHSALAGPLRDICKKANRTFEYASLLHRGENAAWTTLAALGRLFQTGIDVDFASMFPPECRTITELPSYPWDHSEYFWYESRISKNWRQRKFAHHCLLGSRTLESTDIEPQWRNAISIDKELWLADHVIDGDIVFPLAGYVAMAGEGARQLTGVDTGYSLRHTLVHGAMILTRGHDTEVVTSLRPRRLTDSEDSAWFDFTICSHNGRTWLKHIEGQVKPIDRIAPRRVDVDDHFPRKVDPDRFYGALAGANFHFGPDFRTLRRIETSVTRNLARADIAVPKQPSRRGYILDPLVIDACLQLYLVASVRGLCRDVRRMIPFLLEDLDILPARGDLRAVASQAPMPDQQTVQCLADGKVAVQASGLKLACLDDATSDDARPHGAARLEWRPAFDFIDVGPLLKPPASDRDDARVIEEMTVLCAMESVQRLSSLVPAKPHLTKLRNWLQTVVEDARAGGNALAPDAGEYSRLESQTRRRMIDERLETLLCNDSGRTAFGQGLKRILDNCEAIFTGSVGALEILTHEGLLTDIYNAISFDYGDFVRSMAHSSPKLRILEVGAGTGGTTQHILDSMAHPGGLPQYSTYTFSDVSAGFFPEARKRFARAQNMDFKVLDISKDPVHQGFAPETYDVVIAANVVHATPRLRATLANLNKLLAPGGTLVLTELCAVTRCAGYIFGNFDGWWLGEDDGRVDEPFAAPERWHRELLDADFTGVETLVLDDEAPYTLSATMVSRRTSAQPAREKAVSLISSSPDGPVASCIADAFRRDGFDVATLTLADELAPGRDAVVCLDLEGNFLRGLDEHSFALVQGLVRSVDAAQAVVWLTAPNQMRCRDPWSALATGLARAVRLELGLRFCTLEVDAAEERLGELAVRVLAKIRTGRRDGGLAADSEFVVDGGVVCVGRFQPRSLVDERARLSVQGKETTRVLEVTSAGRLESVAWRERVVGEPLEPAAVEIQVESFALNLRDVLMAMGLYKTEAESPPALISDLSGTVTATGEAAEGFAVGDRVCAFTPMATVGTRARVDRRLVSKIPEAMSFDEAATIPTVFVTAIRTLVEIGGLRRGQSVLVHCACGGLGLAAVQVCRMMGAEIFATVGSADKAAHLAATLGLARGRIFHSRDDSFLDGVLRETGGRGVDLVLNSLSGDLMQASMRCVAKFGIMVEVGVRDLLGHGRLELHSLLGNRRYALFDGAEFAAQRPDDVAATLARFWEGYRAGSLAPIQEMTRFESSKVLDAFRHLQKGSHIGKVVVSVSHDDTGAAVQASPVRFDPAGAYLLTGGLGGLGRCISTWLVERGARSLTFLSRSAGGASARAFVDELEHMGCRVRVVAGSVARRQDVDRAVAATTEPIRGVFHLAMVLQDSLLGDMTFAQWEAVVRPKADGAWNLHEALLGQRLDFFWMAGSTAVINGLAGQANYAATSAFLDAFCQFRLGQGLAAAVVDICPIQRVGFVAESAEARRNAERLECYSLEERHLLDFVELSVLQSPPPPTPRAAQPYVNDMQTLMGLRSVSELQDASCRTSWRHDRRMGAYHNAAADADADGAPGGRNPEPLEAFLRAVARDRARIAGPDSADFLARQIGAKLHELLLVADAAVDVRLGLAAMGLDSLVAIQLRQWLREVFSIDVNVLELTRSEALLDVARIVQGALQARYGRESGAKVPDAMHR